MDTLNQLSNHIWKAHISDANVEYAFYRHYNYARSSIIFVLI